MTELHTQGTESPPLEHPAKSTCITSSGSITDPSLSQLREQIKNAMIPLLIKVFHLRLEIQQASSPPSRLQNKQSKAPLDDFIVQLQKLDEDLKLLQLWSQSCRTQVHKVLQEAQEDQPPCGTNQFQAQKEAHPGLHKSFNEALFSQKENAKTTKTFLSNSKESETSSPSEQHPIDKTSWWQKMLRK